MHDRLPRRVRLHVLSKDKKSPLARRSLCGQRTVPTWPASGAGIRAQVITTIVAIFFGMFMNIIIISSATTALQSLDSKQMVGRQQLETITRYLLFKNVPNSMTCQIIDYLEYKIMSTKTMMQLSDFKQLPHEMRLMLTIQLHADIIKECRVLKNLPPKAVIDLLESFQPLVLPPDMIIIAEGKKNRSLYFINRGIVKLWKDYQLRTQRYVATLRDKDFFGEASITGEQHIANATVQCISYCDMLSLSQEEFFKVMAKYNHTPDWMRRKESKEKEKAEGSESWSPLRNLAFGRSSTSNLGGSVRKKDAQGGSFSKKKARINTEAEPASAPSDERGGSRLSTGRLSVRRGSPDATHWGLMRNTIKKAGAIKRATEAFGPKEGPGSA